MGKVRTRTQKISNGERRNVAKAYTRNETSAGDKLINLVKSWKKGQNPWVNVDGVKVQANDYWGNPKRTHCNIYGGRQDND